MSPDVRDPTDPAEWLRRAAGNLALAKGCRNVPGVLLEDLCFQAQQAAEKAAKALFVHLQVDFPKVHDIEVLLALLHQERVAIPDSIRRAGRLTRYAVETRYPGEWGEIREHQYLEAVDLAEGVLHWAESVIRAGKKEG